MIVKPEFAAEGRGIYLIRKIDNMDLNVNMIVQKYIKNPFLIKKLKFDLRVYALVTSINPLRVYINKEGLARFATEEYLKPDDRNIKNLFMHLTNYSINKRSSKFFTGHSEDTCNLGHKRDFESVWKYLEDNGYDSKKAWLSLKKCILKTLISVLPGMRHMYRTS